jgi:hypothetical protein
MTPSAKSAAGSGRCSAASNAALVVSLLPRLRIWSRTSFTVMVITQDRNASGRSSPPMPRRMRIIVSWTMSSTSSRYGYARAATL